jgi:hypothetical protein
LRGLYPTRGGNPERKPAAKKTLSAAGLALPGERRSEER